MGYWCRLSNSRGGGRRRILGVVGPELVEGRAEGIAVGCSDIITNYKQEVAFPSSIQIWFLRKLFEYFAIS